MMRSKVHSQPRSMSPRLGRLTWSLTAGIALGTLATLSPLLLVATALAVLIVVSVRRHLPENEQCTVTTIVLAAIIARVVVVAALAVWSIPVASAQSGGVLFGDEGYLFERSLRTRDIVLGFSVGKLDYMTVFDGYYDTKYSWWLAWLQTTFGPSPYAIRVVNGLLFVAAASVMYRLARRAFGATAAQWGLATLLFLPSLLFWSVSLLKDSVYFLLTTGALAAAVMVARGPRWSVRIGGLAALLGMLWGLADLRPWATPLTVGGIAAGFAIRWTFHSKVRMGAALAGVLLAGAVTAASSPLSTAVLETITWLSQQHIGHATTPGHAYRTLDDEFYPDYQRALGGRPLKPAVAARYIARSAVAFVSVPLPWRLATPAELAYIPEQVVWYVIAAFGVVGLVAAYRRDATFTSLLVGYIVTMSAALALINGNVGTLVRLRGLVTRFVVWIAAVGLMATITKLTGDKAVATSRLVDREGRLAGRLNVVDALCLGVLCGLIPVAYVSWLLFQPAKPEIRSVERSEITSAEEKIAAGQPIRLKVKIRGDHLTPMLRAHIGPVPAMGFTFEGPTSGDVIIGDNVPPGTHDLILYDGPLEVARAPGAVTIAPSTGVSMRAIGAFTLLDERTAKSLHVGQQFQIDGRPLAEILALGAAGPDRRDVKNGSGSFQASTLDTWGRDAIVRMHCDPHPDSARCYIGGTVVADSGSTLVYVPGSAPARQMRVQTIVPDEAPTGATVRVRLEGDATLLNSIRAGERDVRWPSIDDRAATVERIQRAGSPGRLEVVVRLGVDRASDGWQYHSQPILAGGPFTFVTDRYSVMGTVIEMRIDER